MLPGLNSYECLQVAGSKQRVQQQRKVRKVAIETWNDEITARTRSKASVKTRFAKFGGEDMTVQLRGRPDTSNSTVCTKP